jgi:hypothetical protein
VIFEGNKSSEPELRIFTGEQRFNFGDIHAAIFISSNWNKRWNDQFDLL